MRYIKKLKIIYKLVITCEFSTSVHCREYVLTIKQKNSL